MSESFWEKLNVVAGYMAIGVFFCLAAFSANLEIKDLDLWLHVKTGQYIVEHHQVPDHDVLSCSIAGKPWANHEWLFQVIVYSIQNAWGFDGLITMQVVVVCLTLLVFLLICYRPDRQGLIVFTLLLVLLIYQNRFTIRPDIFSLLFFSLNIYILSLCIDRRWSIWAMAFIQVLWVNMHGFFIFGPLMVLLALAAESIKRRVPLPYEWNSVGRLTDNEFKRLQHILVALLLACLVNPLFIKGALYPLKVLFMATGDSKVFFEHITELQKPLTKHTLWNLFHYAPYKLLIIMSAVSFFFNRRKVDISSFFLWVAFLVFSLSAIRNLTYFACAAFLVIMVNCMTLNFENVAPVRFISRKFKLLTAIFAKVGLIIWMLNFGLGLSDRAYVDIDTYETKSEYRGVSQRSFAYHAVDFLIAQNIKGNFFNDFNSGAYLVGRTFPNIKVFIDGRTEVYGGQFFKTYHKLWKQGDKKVFAELDKKCHFTGAFLNNTNQEVPPPVLRLFYGLKDWRVVYFNYDAVIFLKNVPQNQRVIEKYAVDLAKWQPPAPELQKIGTKRIYPFPHVDRAKLLMDLKLEGPALKELSAALKVAPDAIDAYKMLGEIYGRQKQYRKAFENFRIAAMYAPNRTNRKNLAWAYERLGNYTVALEMYERLLAQDPKDAKIKAKIERLKKKLKGKHA